MKLIILIGLQGSGKSTWAKKFESENLNCKHIELDKCCILKPIYFTLEDAIQGEVIKNIKFQTIILDFIFKTKEDILTIINSCNNFNVKQVELHYWEIDRKQCLINDSLRVINEKRKHDCSYSIETSRIEEPKLEYFRESMKKYDFSICNHEVYMPNEKTIN